ncbi:uncharacterized protein LOC132048767 [Lycium ferocissimum]|uniref:uncharacterized protein LOC132048767 n=1 Tax=Lycium ferocissimum TaxID=112874 RepID=UPI002816260D|nr:uncharacterized protein LOC132048767 [Lycium ferocissimum]
MGNKYLKKNNQVLVPWKQGSLLWRKMLEARDHMDHHIWWQLRMGSSLFWFDNWTGAGPLYFLTSPDFYCNEDIQNRGCTGYTLGVLESNEELTVKSAWDLVRSRGQKQEVYNKIWVKGLPFKIAFTMWRVWHLKVPLDDVVKSWVYNLPSKCLCCPTDPKEETVPHIFLRCEIAQTLWTYFSHAAVLNIVGMQLHQVIMTWWTIDIISRMKAICTMRRPSIIIWQLWKKRNGDKHKNKVSNARVLYQASADIQKLVKIRKPGIKNVPLKWPDILRILEQFKPKLQVTQVWGNPGRSSYAFCVRDSLGDLVYARAKEIGEATNTESEAIALLEAAKFYLSKHMYSFILETDSMMMKKIVDREWRPPWNIAYVVEELLEIIDNAEVEVLHIMREGNQLADHLDNVALDFGEVTANGFAELDTKGRKILNSDKLICPYLRIRTKRRLQVHLEAAFMGHGNDIETVKLLHLKSKVIQTSVGHQQLSGFYVVVLAPCAQSAENLLIYGSCSDKYKRDTSFRNTKLELERLMGHYIIV